MPVVFKQYQENSEMSNVSTLLVEKLELVLATMFSEGKVSGGAFRIGNKYGAAGGSLAISLTGEKRGCWIDHSTQENGHVLGLIAAHHDLNLQTQKEQVIALGKELLAKIEQGDSSPAKSSIVNKKILISGASKVGKLPKASNDPDLLCTDAHVVGSNQTQAWEYVSTDGTYFCTIQRQNQPNGKKKFVAINKDTGEYKCPTGKRPLYNAIGILLAETVIYVEGEKCADVVNQHGFTATTTMMGANAPVEKNDYTPLAGKRVIFWGDNDEPGIAYVRAAAKAAQLAGATSIEILKIPDGKPEKWDVADAAAETPPFDIVKFIENGERITFLELEQLQNPQIILDSDSIEGAVSRLNQMHALVIVGGQTCVLTETVDHQGRPEILLGRPSELSARYANVRVVRKNLLGKKQDVSIDEVWMKHPDRRTYDGIVFAPQGAPDNFYNLFRGFSVQPAEGDCGLYLQHLRQNVCQGNLVFENYLLNWMAHLVQMPQELPGIGIVLIGAQGTGKGVFTDELGRLVDPHYIVLNGLEQLVGRFTGHLKDKVLVYANEAVWGGNKAGEGALKTMITDPDASVEQKFKDIIRIENFKRVIISSNEQWAAPLGKDDRRFFVLNCGSDHKEDHAYFSAIVDQMRNGGSEALMHFLMNRDLTDFNVRKVPPTQFSFSLKLLSMDSVDQFVYEYLRAAGNESWSETVLKSHLHGEYIEWCKAHGKKHPHPQSIFGKNLFCLMPSMSHCKKKSTNMFELKTRHWHYVFESFKQCRSEFEKACKAGPEIWEI